MKYFRHTEARKNTDNGPPFQERKFPEFVREEDFHHHKITPLHPQAIGHVEVFMKILNKIEQISNLQRKDKI